MGTQDLGGMMDRLRPTFDGSVMLLEAVQFTEYSDQAFQETGPLFYSGIVQGMPEWL